MVFDRNDVDRKMLDQIAEEFCVEAYHMPHAPDKIQRYGNALADIDQQPSFHRRLNSMLEYFAKKSPWIQDALDGDILTFCTLLKTTLAVGLMIGREYGERETRKNESLGLQSLQ